ncbi:hypothetical protein CR513_28543, partial [Mucuna pruriens]
MILTLLYTSRQKLLIHLLFAKQHIYIRPILKKTPYELCKGRQPNISYFHPFICDCFILNSKDNLCKFDPKYDKETFIGYSTTSKAYKVYNSRTLKVKEFIHVKLYDSKPDKELSELNEPFVKSLGMFKIESELGQTSKTKLKWVCSHKLNPRT